MQFKQFRAVALATTAVMGIALLPTNTQAANPETMNASIEAIAAITVAKLNDMNFGKWLLNHENAEDMVLTLDPLDNSVEVNGGVALVDSTAQQLASTSRGGRLAVTIPAGINNYSLHMSVDNVVQYTDTEYEITAVTYATATEAVTPIPLLDGTGDYPVTVLTGGTAEVVYFGGDLTVTADPTDTTTPQSASFDVLFAY